MIPKIRRSDMSGPLLDVGVQTSEGMFAFLPAMTWPEASALRDELATFLMDARNAEAPMCSYLSPADTPCRLPQDGHWHA
jgi:hypothetical protein